MEKRAYVAIDLKSFYASVECMDRRLDPLGTCLVVADGARTDKTICLAVSPALKKFGVPGRPRLFEVVSRVSEVNEERRRAAPGRRLTGSSTRLAELEGNPNMAIDYIVATPRMARYIEISTQIYRIYLRHVSPEDIHVYSVDEVFIDVTPYLSVSGMTARDFAMMLIREVLAETGITATAGIGTNLYLCKIAMDIKAKRMKPDRDGVRIAELDELSYRQELWDHRPITDFWRIGPGYAEKLAAHGMTTMGDVACRSVCDEETLYRLFGVNAELLIDHAWGWENCTLSDIKSYRPTATSVTTGQVLQKGYSFDGARLVICEMADQLALDLVNRGVLTDQLVLSVGYDTQSLRDPAVRKQYGGSVETDYLGREVPVGVHGSVNLGGYTSSSREIVRLAAELWDRLVNRRLLVRRINLVANHTLPEAAVVSRSVGPMQMDLLTDYREQERQEKAAAEARARERRLQSAEISIHAKYGKSALLKGMNLEPDATGAQRNRQIGGHLA